MDPDGGWIALPRYLFHPDNPQHPARTGERACRAFAWTDLIALARYEPAPGIPRGSCIASCRFLANRWNWDRSTVSRWLAKLEAMGMIERATAAAPDSQHPGQLITVCHYDAYTMPWKTPATPAQQQAQRRSKKNLDMKRARTRERKPPRPAPPMRQKGQPLPVTDILAALQRKVD